MGIKMEEKQSFKEIQEPCPDITVEEFIKTMVDGDVFVSHLDGHKFYWDQAEHRFIEDWLRCRAQMSNPFHFYLTQGVSRIKKVPVEWWETFDWDKNLAVCFLSDKTNPPGRDNGIALVSAVDNNHHERFRLLNSSAGYKYATLITEVPR